MEEKKSKYTKEQLDEKAKEMKTWLKSQGYLKEQKKSSKILVYISFIFLGFLACFLFLYAVQIDAFKSEVQNDIDLPETNITNNYKFNPSNMYDFSPSNNYTIINKIYMNCTG